MSLRLFLLGLPALAVAATWWAGHAAKASREARAGDLVALLSAAEMPRLNPFAPATEADRQLIDLLHAPLVKIGSDGRIQPMLAAEWRWLTRITVWFATPEDCIDAQARLEHMPAPQRASWKLVSSATAGRALQLTFDDMLATNLRDVLRAAAARVQTVTIVRIDAPQHAQAAHTALLTRQDFAAAEQRLWFDHEDAFEIAAVGVSDNALQDWQQHLTASLPAGSHPMVRVQTQQPTLDEPVLEFRLREDARWPDGTRVGAQDVLATFAAVMHLPALLHDRDGLRHARTVEAMATDRVQAIYWRHHGPALCDWLELPILPATWLSTHLLDAQDALPPGAGPYCLERYDFHSLVIRPAAAHASAVNRLTLVTNFSSFSMQLGYKTHALDFFWPNAPAMTDALQREALQSQDSPAHHLVQVVFNTGHAPLNDVHLRVALAAATDRVALAQQLPNHAHPHASLFAPGLWLSGNPPIPTPDLFAAEHALAKGGWLRNVNNLAARSDGSLMLNLLVPANDSALKTIAVPLAEQWRKLGVQVLIRLADRDAFEKLLVMHEFDVALVADRPNATWDLATQWHSASDANRTGYKDRQIDLLLEALSHEFDPDEAAQRARLLEKTILESCAVLPLLTLHDQALLRSDLSPSSHDDAGWTLRELLVR
jgi:ABC-type transport system substrate-binding protein